MGPRIFTFTVDPYIPSTYFAVGGTPKSAFEIEAKGSAPVPSHHSPLLKLILERPLFLVLKQLLSHYCSYEISVS